MRTQMRASPSRTPAARRQGAGRRDPRGAATEGAVGSSGGREPTPWGRLPSQALCWMKRVMGISFFFRPSLTTGRTLRGPDCPGNQQGTQGRPIPFRRRPGKPPARYRQPCGRHPQTQGTREEGPLRASPVACEKAPALFEIRASKGQSSRTRTTAPRLLLAPPAESRQPSLPPQEEHRRRETGTPPRFLHGSRRERSRETIGVGADVRREHFRETAAVGAGIRKDPSAIAEGSRFSERALRLLPFCALPRRPSRPVGLPRSFKPPRPGSPRGRAAWRCDRNTAGSRAPPRRPGRSPARRSTAPPGGSTRGSRA